MIRLPDKQLPKATLTALANYQNEVNGESNYSNQVQKAKDLWKKYPKNKPFVRVRQTLLSMCCGAQRCAYCEDSFADEIEHVRPKDIYPECVFEWLNYAYACGPCNGPKNNNYAVFLHGKPVSIARRQADPVTPPPSGKHVLLDPRAEDPLDFLWLDLETFVFIENAKKNTRRWHRANYTINTLRLNAREMLIEARKNAFGSFRARLFEYASIREANPKASDLARLRDELRAMHHITVFAEMQRQHKHYPALKSLFVRAPEALGWKPLYQERS